MQRGENRPAVDRSIKLTTRGQEVAEFVALGLSNREIAKRIFLSERTVEWHVEQILNRLGFTSRSEIAAWIGRTQTAVAVHVPLIRRGNLPAPLTSFVGRQQEVAGLHQHLARNRLVTLFGPGGSGKTRLAIKVADELQVRYADGVWLCDLAPVADPALVGDAVAHALGLAIETTDRLAAAREHLRERTALIVLDNCEHLLASASDVAEDLLAACPELRILATSLAPLGVLGEAVWRLQALPQKDAIELFVARAQAAVPDFQLDEATERGVATICQRLEGLPLALELTAPKLRLLSVAELADAVLESTARRSGDRHGSLDALAAWGFETLGENERDLFARLGVFAGWFDQEDGAAVASDAAVAPSLLASLVESSMVFSEGTSRDDRRYRLLETLKSYARRRLTESGQLNVVRLAHAERMISLAEAVALGSSDMAAVVSPKIAASVDDMRAAMTSLLDLRPRRAARLAAALGGFWHDVGRISEGVSWLRKGLAAKPESPDRCWLLYRLARLLLALDRRPQGRPEDRPLPADAMLALGEANLLIDSPECADMRPHLLQFRGAVYLDLGDLAEAEMVFRKSIQGFIESGRQSLSARPLNGLAMSLLYAGRFAEARDLAARSISLQPRNPEALDTLAQACALAGDFDQARALWLEALPLALENQVTTVPVCLEGLAYTAAMHENKESAIRLHHCAQYLFGNVEGLYDQPLTPTLNEALAALESELGPEETERLRAEGIELTIPEAIQLAQGPGLRNRY